PDTELSRGALIFAFVIAIGFAIALFKVTPGLITELLPIKSGGWFVIVEGLIRVSLFVAYLGLISLLPDLRRVFQYHAAEHKAINAYEAGEELRPEVVQRYSLIHPRCGTAFLLWVMVLAVFVFAFFGRPHWYWLIAERILLLPLIAGLAYELIRFAGKHSDHRVLMTLLAPGMWLQRLTTREPTLDQIEVSIRALREVLHLEESRSAENRVEGSRRLHSRWRPAFPGWMTQRSKRPRRTRRRTAPCRRRSRPSLRSRWTPGYADRRHGRQLRQPDRRARAPVPRGAAAHVGP